MTGLKIKVCGITRPEDAVACHAAGVEYLGVIFAKSPRQVTPTQAKEIRRAVPRARLVGVFSGADLREVAATAEATRLNLVQLHGNETPEYCATLRARLSLPIVKTLLRGGIPQPQNLAAYSAASFLLLDLSKDESDPDGGRQSLWGDAARIRERGYRVFLAGTLDPHNVREAVARARPFAVDVCRGVEAAPGIKDHDAVKRFITEARR